MSIPSDLHIDSLLAHGGGGHDVATGAVVPPIPTATTFVRDENYDLTDPGHLYSRDDNELFRRAENLIATLEGGQDSRLFASGMAATAAVARVVRPGGTMLVQSGIYWGTTLFLRKHCARNNIAIVEADASDLSAFSDELAVTNPDLVWLEVPSNPFLRVADIEKISQICKTSGALLAVDATAATPLILKPLSLGADLAMHSTTKAINGHSDVLGGIVTTGNATSEAWTYLCEERKLGGAVMGSFEAWLLIRGMRTMALRVERMNESAQAIAEHFANHPKVDEVIYPGLTGHPDHYVAKKQMVGGYGSVLSIRTKGGRQASLKVAGGMKLVQRATSIGGTESLLEHRETIEGPESGIPDNLLRLSVGIENTGDLVQDIEQALAHA